MTDKIINWILGIIIGVQLIILGLRIASDYIEDYRWAFRIDDFMSYYIYIFVGAIIIAGVRVYRGKYDPIDRDNE